MLLEKCLRCIQTLCVALHAAHKSPVHGVINYAIMVRLFWTMLPDRIKNFCQVQSFLLRANLIISSQRLNVEATGLCTLRVACLIYWVFIILPMELYGVLKTNYGKIVYLFPKPRKELLKYTHNRTYHNHNYNNISSGQYID